VNRLQQGQHHSRQPHASPAGLRFKHEMPLWQRIVILQWGALLTLVGLVLLAGGLLFAYVMLMAIFNS